MNDGPRVPAAAGAQLLDVARAIVVSLGEGRELAIEGIGWATVELDRAERELAEALGTALVAPFGPADPDAILGADARAGGLVSGERVVLLEPNTEGRLAAFLASRGEGVAVVYASDPAHPPEGDDARPSQRLLRRGPLGPSRHLAGSRQGPHLIEVPAPRREAGA